MSTTPGTYVAIEGLDGTGKTTQASMLAHRCRARQTKEPGGTPVGSEIRQIFLHYEMLPATEACLLAADRAEHLATIILPDLEAGLDVVSDRSIFSSLAYQGFGRELGAAMVWDLNRAGRQRLIPDVVVYLEVPTEEADRRLTDRGQLDRLEAADEEFQARVRFGYRILSMQHEDIFVNVDGTGDPIEVHERLVTALLAHPRFRPEMTTRVLPTVEWDDALRR